jgi:hypothetical protein
LKKKWDESYPFGNNAYNWFLNVKNNICQSNDYLLMIGAGVERSDALDIACKNCFIDQKILMIVQSFSDKVNI